MAAKKIALPKSAQADPGEIMQTAPTAPSAPSSDVRYLAHAFEPLPPLTLGDWDVGRIRDARDSHAIGDFVDSGLLADAMLTDPRIFAGLGQRLGPLLGIPRTVKGNPRWNGKGLSETARREAEILFRPKSSACPPGTLAAGFGATAMMGATILQNVWTPAPSGARMNVEVRPWPMQTTTWNENLRRYQIRTTEGLITVQPNDGKWIVIEPWGPRSYLRGALRPLALVWADRALAMRDRSNHSAAHGSMSIVGTLPEKTQLRSPEGADFVAALQNLQNARAGIVKPYGSAVDGFEPKTLAWQIFGQIVKSSNDDVMLALAGINNDTVYKPISQLDGVRYDIVASELGAAATQYSLGLLLPWAIYNFDNEDVAPEMEWLVPDPREQERLEALGRRHKAFTDALQAYRKSSVVVDDDFVARLAKQFDVEAPKLAPAPTTAAAAPADDSKKTPSAETGEIRREAGEAA
jgi:hypothetical protein